MSDAISALIGGLFGLGSSGIDYAANAAMAREQREWAERMSNTALQRYRKDAEAAGFNPILGMSGGGAASPPGNAGSMRSTNPAASAAEMIRSRASSAAALGQARLANAQAAAVESGLPTKKLKEEIMTDITGSARGVIDEIKKASDPKTFEGSSLRWMIKDTFNRVGDSLRGLWGPEDDDE